MFENTHNDCHISKSVQPKFHISKSVQPKCHICLKIKKYSQAYNDISFRGGGYIKFGEGQSLRMQSPLTPTADSRGLQDPPQTDYSL